MRSGLVVIATGMSFLCLALTAGCITHVARLPLARPPSFNVSLTPDEAESDAVILKDEVWLTHYLNRGATSTAEEVRRVVYLVNDAGAEYARVQIPYYPNSPIVTLQARTILPDGTVVPVPDSAILDSEGARLGVTERNATRIKSFAFPRAGAGAVLEYRYVREHPGWLMSFRYVVNEPVPVRSAAFTTEMPRVVVRHARRGFGAPRELGRRQTWRVTNVSPAEWISFPLPEHERAPYVDIVVERLDFVEGGYGFKQPVYDGWPAVARPLWSAVEKIIEDPPNLFSGPPTDSDADKARRFWTTVQRDIDDRWFIASSGRTPRRAHEIYLSGFGTADERALVMLAALRAQRIPALLLLLPGVDEPDATEEFPTPDRLSDLIVCVPSAGGPPLLLDPTCLGCSAGELAVHHQGRTGLLVTGARTATPGLKGFDFSAREDAVRVKTRLFTTALPDPSQPSTELRTDLTVNDRGLVATRGVWTARGALAASIRHYFAQHPLSQAKRRELMRKKYLDDVQEGQIGIEGLEDVGAPIRLHLKDVPLQRSGFIRTAEWTMIPVHAVGGVGWIEELARKESGDVHFPVAPSFTRESRVGMPDGHEVVSVPTACRSKSKVGSYQLDIKTELETVLLSESLTLRQGTFKHEERKELAAFLRKVGACRRRNVVLRKVERSPVATRYFPGTWLPR